MKFVKIPGQQYEMQVTLVAQHEWEKVMGNNPSYFKGKNNPVEQVSWNDVQDFIIKLNKKDKKYIYRLPTEQEWEFCAKSCDDQNVNKISWNWGNSDKKTYPVAKKLPNKLGLYDMLGNVWEWTDSLEGSYRVIRGGSWFNDASVLRSAFRSYYSPGIRDYYLGFRLVRTCNSGQFNHFTIDKEKISEAIAKAQAAIDDLKTLIKDIK